MVTLRLQWRKKAIDAGKIAWLGVLQSKRLLHNCMLPNCGQGDFCWMRTRPLESSNNIICPQLVTMQRKHNTSKAKFSGRMAVLDVASIVYREIIIQQTARTGAYKTTVAAEGPVNVWLMVNKHRTSTNKFQTKIIVLTYSLNCLRWHSLITCTVRYWILLCPTLFPCLSTGVWDDTHLLLSAAAVQANPKKHGRHLSSAAEHHQGSLNYHCLVHVHGFMIYSQCDCDASYPDFAKLLIWKI